MKFLILSQYYPPETGAPQNRLHSLVLNLVKNGCDVEVLTAMPNYPKMEIFEGYKGLSYLKEYLDGVVETENLNYLPEQFTALYNEDKLGGMIRNLDFWLDDVFAKLVTNK